MSLRASGNDNTLSDKKLYHNEREEEKKVKLFEFLKVANDIVSSKSRIS